MWAGGTYLPVTVRPQPAPATTSDRAYFRSPVAASQDVHVLVERVLADGEVLDRPRGERGARQPLGGEERRPPLGVLDAPVTRLAELGREPVPAAVELAADAGQLP